MDPQKKELIYEETAPYTAVKFCMELEEIFTNHIKDLNWQPLAKLEISKFEFGQSSVSKWLTNRSFFSTEDVLNAILNSGTDSSDTDEEDSKAESSVDERMSSDDCFFFGLTLTRSW